jgi:hypothetical protein
MAAGYLLENRVVYGEVMSSAAKTGLKFQNLVDLRQVK